MEEDQWEARTQIQGAKCRPAPQYSPSPSSQVNPGKKNAARRNPRRHKKKKKPDWAGPARVGLGMHHGAPRPTLLGKETPPKWGPPNSPVRLTLLGKR